MPEKIVINAIAFRGEHAWVVQGIEHDIVAFTHDVTLVPEAFTRAVMENIRVSEHLGREALEGIKPAPDHYRTMFEQAKTEVRSLVAPKALPKMGIPALSFRVAERAQAA